MAAYVKVLLLFQRKLGPLDLPLVTIILLGSQCHRVISWRHALTETDLLLFQVRSDFISKFAGSSFYADS